MYGYEHGSMVWGWPIMFFMWLIPILLIALVVWLFIGRRTGRVQPSAREILDSRYAEGKIERDEYIKRLEDLKR
ncbi:electron transporter RnfE [Parazoarcus communis]|uniref:Electron transporter RnfE n=1 Tax=Parazoarcus communis TaxID=41977 RepID=A0A2U8GM16_9RHOO|nr:electron transporter RnfE [Parazoarcus communis]AWI74649.1 electron transporter RnfE [Parazoarcus communis]